MARLSDKRHKLHDGKATRIAFKHYTFLISEHQHSPYTGGLPRGYPFAQHLAFAFYTTREKKNGNTMEEVPITDGRGETMGMGKEHV